jgi:uncharacterized membrane protein YbhN (UPF0104 family)
MVREGSAAPRSDAPEAQRDGFSAAVDHRPEKELGKEETDITSSEESRAASGGRRSHLRSILVGLLELVISATLLWIVFARIELAEIKGRLAQLSYMSALLVAGLILIHALLSAARWRALLCHLGGYTTLWRAISGVLAERFVSQAVPSPFGDGVRVLEMTRSGQALRLVAYSVLVDRLFALAGLFAVVSTALPLAPWVINSDSMLRTVLVLGVLPLLGLAALVLVRRRWWEMIRRTPFLHYPAGLALQLRAIVIAPRIFTILGGLSLLAQAIPILCFLILANDLHIPLATMDAVVIVPVIMLVAVLPISIAGWGLREGAAVVLMAQVGVNSSDALLLSVLFGLITLGTGCFGGLLWLVNRHGRGMRLRLTPRGRQGPE